MSNDFWRSRKVFLTGATGFLGTWLVRELLAREADVTALVRDVDKAGALLPGVKIVAGHVEDYEAVESLIAQNQPDTVFHLAAQAIVGIAGSEPRSTFESNVRGTYNLLEACRKTPSVRRVIVASTDKAYGDQEQLPYTEEMPLQGRYPYDVSKACADMIAQSYAVTYRVPVCTTRCVNLYGGEDLNFNRIIPGTIRSALRGESPVIRSDGTFIRDYLYVKDAVAGYLRLAEAMDDPVLHGQAFNFSAGFHINVLDLTRQILVLVGRTDLEPTVLNQVKNEIRDQYLSAAKAQRLLGWSPAYSPQTALEETIDWYRAQRQSGDSG